MYRKRRRDDRETLFLREDRGESMRFIELSILLGFNAIERLFNLSSESNFEEELIIWTIKYRGNFGLNLSWR